MPLPRQNVRPRLSRAGHAQYREESSQPMTAPRHSARRRRPPSRAEKLLVAVFLLTLPLVNPWVRGDGVGYYAYLHALLIRGDLNFQPEWLHGNPSFTMSRVGPDGRLAPDQFTRTGRVDNHFSVGPAMLWAPLVAPVHAVVLALDRLGARIPADGYSRPYRVAMALGTACYGFLGLWLSFALAQRFFPSPWPLLATLAVWFGTSLPVYMYFNPSWSHALSAFAVALFVWYWVKTRGTRTPGQWVALGLIGGLMVDVYYPNAVVLLLPAGEFLGQAVRASRAELRALVVSGAGGAAAGLAALLPTFITRAIIYGSPFELGYGARWTWQAPALGRVLFSADHGLFSWTPIAALAVAGLFLLLRRDRALGGYLLALFFAFYYLIACYQDWDGISSYGNRFFVSLTPLFVLGLAALLDGFARLWRRPVPYGTGQSPRTCALEVRGPAGMSGASAGAGRGAILASASALGLLVVWNLGFIFQWGTHLVPARGPISWRAMAHNQVAVVPREFFGTARTYFLERKAMMGRIEREDVRTLRDGRP
jgi:hypothetical protein